MAASVRCDVATREGRLAKATQFRDAAVVVATMADDASDVLDACVTLLVHAGIAAADVCCTRLGRHAQGESHREAVDLLATVDRSLAKDLTTLLGMKTQAGYSAITMSADKHRRATRAADRLVDAAISA